MIIIRHIPITTLILGSKGEFSQLTATRLIQHRAILIHLIIVHLAIIELVDAIIITHIKPIDLYIKERRSL